MKSTAHKFQLAKRAASTLNIINNKKIPPSIKKRLLKFININNN